MTRERAEEECRTLGEAYDEGYHQGRLDAIDEFFKKAIDKQHSLFINPSITEQMLFKEFLYYIAKQLKEN